MARPVMLAALLVSGCSQIFGLAPPELTMPDAAPSDSDGDTIIDDEDNCPDVANTDQTDLDKDLVGDACQGCLTLPLRAGDDDDEDTVPDTTDVCMSVAGTSIADGDGDGIWNACDPRTGADLRFCVFTFRDPAVGEDPNIWPATWDLGGWTLANSAIHMSRVNASGNVASIRDAAYSSPGGIAFELRATLGSYTMPAAFGLRIEATKPGANTPSVYECRARATTSNSSAIEILRDGNVMADFVLTGALPSPINGMMRMMFDVEGTDVNMRCTMDTATLPPVSVSSLEPGPLGVLEPGILATNADVTIYDFVVYELGEQ